MPGTLFIVSAPSGAGKTTIVSSVLDDLKCTYDVARVVTYTSKNPRYNEQDGVDYHFISRQEFEQRIQAGFFLEWSLAYNHYYGTPQHVIHNLKQEQSLVLIIDRLGTQQILARCEQQNIVTIWIHPKNIDILRDRLDKRNADKKEDIEYRMARALVEITDEERDSIYKYRILNDDLDSAIGSFKRIILDEILREKMVKKDTF